MSDRSYSMTQAALENLRKELQHKLEVERPALAARLKSAIEMGDLSENADYHAAKEDQAFMEGRIETLQEMIRGAEIINEGAKPTGYVQLGSTITVQEDGEDSQEIYYLVGKVEADPRQGRISDESPLGAALMGRKKGDTVRVDAPAGQTTFRIIDIS